MTVHQVRVLMDAANVTNSEAAQYIRTWAEDHPHVVESEEVPARVQDDSTTDAVPHVLADYRLSLSLTRSTLLENLENLLQNHAIWYVLAYHGCTHDGTGGGCQWNEQRTFGPIPSEVSL